jgi:hypothetical protein
MSAMEARKKARLGVGDRVVMRTVLGDGAGWTDTELVVIAEAGEPPAPGHVVMAGDGLWFDALTGAMAGPTMAGVAYCAIRRAKAGAEAEAGDAA